MNEFRNLFSNRLKAARSPLTRHLSPLFRVILTAVFTCLTTLACSGPGYYWQAASGQYQLMRDRQDIEELLNNPETRPELAERLRTSREILDFARRNLDLPGEDSYTSYVETGREAVVWNVVAAPEFSLQARKWCFPVAGCVPYRGYFHQEKAERAAMRLQDKGYDVSVSPVTAYSTLGWFKDPLLDTMMRSTNARMAATMIHELAHQKIFVKGDTGFNEAYASFVQYAGVMQWLVATADLQELGSWRQSQAVTDQFRSLLATTRLDLQRLYKTTMPSDEMRTAKATIFADLKDRYDQIRTEQWAGRDYFAGWFEAGINNADLALFYDYQDGVCSFSKLFADADQDFSRFHQLARQVAELDPVSRRKWLMADCSAIASQPDL